MSHSFGLEPDAAWLRPVKGFTFPRICGLQSERPLQRQASRASKTRLCSAERALPRPVENWRAHPPAQLSICLVFCGVWNRAVRSGWQRKIRARQIPKRCGRTLRKQVWVSAWTSNLPCFKPRTYAHSVHSALSSGLHPQLCSGFAFSRPAGQKMLASRRAFSPLPRRPQRLKLSRIPKHLGHVGTRTRRPGNH